MLLETNKKPVKSKNLKVIDQLGTLYATFDGSSIWKIDKVAFGILRLCDGKKSFDEIVGEVSKRALVSEKDLAPVLKEILSDLERMRFIEWV